ncbi:winged helix-turn-helix domain-containing protein [Moraxella atlantae]|uniref:winged helix-turn-helix domain-containing protein n=1 Tax=Faucicola atlantae TaxID=34059 RepID=UPI003753CFFA
MISADLGILAYIKNSPRSVSSYEIAVELGMHQRTAQRHLKALYQAGYLEKNKARLQTYVFKGF